jgi:hypothetical protein
VKKRFLTASLQRLPWLHGPGLDWASALEYHVLRCSSDLKTAVRHLEDEFPEKSYSDPIIGTTVIKALRIAITAVWKSWHLPKSLP